MRKSDLKNGMVVETRESRYLVCDGKLIDNVGWMDLKDYSEDFKLKEDYSEDFKLKGEFEDDEFDIIRIYKVENWRLGLRILKDENILKRFGGLIWERKKR